MHTIMEKTNYFLAIDIGGTWIKACWSKSDIIFSKENNLNEIENNYAKVKSSLHKDTTINEFIILILKVIENLKINNKNIKGIGISTAGIVNYHGSKVLKTASHLNVLKNEKWKETLERQFQCKAIVVNDADAATIGLAELNYLKGNKTIGIMPIGTGLGFTVWRNGRRWRPKKSLPLLGSIRLPNGDYNAVASASKLAILDKNNSLLEIFTSPNFKIEREAYIKNLARIINTAAILYNLDEVIICGGLANAISSCNFPMGKQLNKLLENTPAELDKPVIAKIATEGNQLQLIGALALAKGESIAAQKRVTINYGAMETEVPYNKELHLEKMQSAEIIQTLWKAEQEAGFALKNNLKMIADIADRTVDKLKSGGRIIYVGAGSSGRIAAMDTVEIPCTYGFPEDRIVTLVSGGIADAAIEIESDFEEDASAVPEMLLLNINTNDVVIGISASGTAYYVQSALAFAKSRGALSIQIQVNQPKKELPFCDVVIPLNSGNEVVAGSTRMKAGTATKKVLNFFSSTVMIKLGKVAGSYMVDMACINMKLVERAQVILKKLYHIDEEEAIQRLQNADMNLYEAIKTLNKE